MEDRMTKEQVIQETIKVMNEIRVPVKCLDDIGQMIKGCVRNLQIVLQMMDAEKEQAEEKETEPVETEEAEG